jgi:DNA-binding FadR family transcriptional regulator
MVNYPGRVTHGRTQDLEPERLPSAGRQEGEWEPLRRPAEVAEQLESLAGAAGPGRRLGTKDELREQCGVSVGTFNEALRMAQARGFVTVRRGPGGGLFAGTPTAIVRLGNAVLSLSRDARDVAEAIRLRNALDPLLVADAMTHGQESDFAELGTLVDEMRDAAEVADVETFLHANWRLHARLAEIVPGQILRSLYLGLLEIIETRTRSIVAADEASTRDDLRGRLELHEKLVAAIARRDPEAFELIQEHNTGDPTTGRSPA